MRQRIDDGVPRARAWCSGLCRTPCARRRRGFPRISPPTSSSGSRRACGRSRRPRRRSEELESDGVFYLALQAAYELARVFGARLQEVVQHEDGSPHMVLHVLDVADEQLRIAPRHAATSEVVLERVGAAAAGGAVARAAAAGEACRHGGSAANLSWAGSWSCRGGAGRLSWGSRSPAI